jgi:hypothetical protein
VSTFDLNNDPFIREGLERLRLEAFGPSGFAIKAGELVDVVVHRRASTFWRGRMYVDGQKVHRGRDVRYSDEALDDWLDECRVRAYVPGIGTWTTAEVHVFPDQPGRLDLFDEEHLERDSDGEWFPGGHPSGAASWTQQLLAYPRTADNIPAWMWEIFRGEGVIPPVYNAELESVDWDNRRRSVTDLGTDLSAEPTVIDPSLEPGVFSRIGKKLFGG